MYKSLISRNNDVIFYGSLWIMWSLAWILIISLAYSMNPGYDLIELFNGEMANNSKFLWISVIFLVTLLISIITLVMFSIKTLVLHKNTKIYNLNDGGLLSVYFITTVFFYVGIVFFILYKERLVNIRTASNAYESKKMSNYIGDRTRGVELSDRRVINVYRDGAVQNHAAPAKREPNRGRL